jgi:hypothetical protein
MSKKRRWNMEVIRKFRLLLDKEDAVEKYVKEKLKPVCQEYEAIPKNSSSYYPYHTVGFVPVRVARFFPNELSLYIEPGIYPVYSYLPFFHTVSILVPQKYAKFRDKYAISIPEYALYEVEIVLDDLSQNNIQSSFDKDDVNIAFVFPTSQSSFALPFSSFGSYPFVRFENIYLYEAIYFAYEVCSNKYSYILKPYMIYPVVQVVDEIWNAIENLEQTEEE